MANSIIPTSDLVKNLEDLFHKSPYREIIFSKDDRGYSFKVWENHKEVYSSEIYKDQEDCMYRGYVALNALHDSKPLKMQTDKVQHYTARKTVRTNGWEGF